MKSAHYSFIETLENLILDTTKRLESIPFFQNVVEGKISTDEYAMMLVQLHRYVRFTESSEQVLANEASKRAHHDSDALAIETLTQHEVAEEHGHDQLLVEDLATLWQINTSDARQRLENTPAAPSVLAWSKIIKDMLKNHPEAVTGVAFVLENLACLYTDRIRYSLLDTGKIPGIQNALSFFVAHSGEIDAAHAERGRVRLSHLKTPSERSSTTFYAGTALAMFEGIILFLNERFINSTGNVAVSA